MEIRSNCEGMAGVARRRGIGESPSWKPGPERYGRVATSGRLDAWVDCHELMLTPRRRRGAAGLSVCLGVEFGGGGAGELFDGEPGLKIGLEGVGG